MLTFMLFYWKSFGMFIKRTKAKLSGVATAVLASLFPVWSTFPTSLNTRLQSLTHQLSCDSISGDDVLITLPVGGFTFTENMSKLQILNLKQTDQHIQSASWVLKERKYLGNVYPLCMVTRQEHGNNILMEFTSNLLHFHLLAKVDQR